MTRKRTREEQEPMADRGEPSPPGSYAQWLRRTLRRVRAERTLLVSLFESSVPEPREMLRALVAEGFGETITSRYASAFSGGNPFVVEQLMQRYGVDHDRLLCTTGATGALSLIYRALLKPGDRVLIETPAFDLFDTIARSYGHEVDHFARTGARFAIDAEEVAAKLRPDTRLIVLSDLHNPSGMRTDPAVIAEISRLAAARDVLVVVDEVYRDYADADAPTVHLGPNIITISSLTKIYGLSTLRCGWIVAAPAVMRTIRVLNDEVEFGVSNLAHAVAAMVLERRERFDAYSAGIVSRGRPVIEAYFAHWHAHGLIAGDLPEFGCIAFPRLIGIDDTDAFSDWIAARGAVVVAPGSYFGAPGHVRIGFGLDPTTLEYGLQALTDGMKTYRDRTARPAPVLARD
jgi:aspartate/methionine/tyrosine aminotransferase